LKQSQRIVKNALAGGLGTAVGGLLQLLIVLLLAHHLDVAEFGFYSFTVALAFVTERAADLGMSNILMRDLSIDQSKTASLLGSALSLAWTICFGVAIAIFGTLPFLHFDRSKSILTALMVLGGLWQCLCGCYGAVLRAREDNELHALGSVLHKVVLLGALLVALRHGLGLGTVVAAYLVANVAQWWLFRRIVLSRYARPHIRIDLQLWKYLIVSSVPTGAAVVVRLLAEQSDVLVLTWLGGLQAAGLFSGPYKLAAGLRFIPQSIAIALFPMYSRAAIAGGSRTEFLEAYERGFKWFLLMAFPAAMLLAAAPRTLTIGLLGVSYGDATPAMRLLGVGVLLLFAGSPFPFLLTAINQQRFLFTSSAIALGVRVGLNFALISRLGFLGPCYGLILAESVLIAMWIGGLRRAGFSLPFFRVSWRPCAAAIPAGGLLHLLGARSLFTLSPAVFLACLLYVIFVIKLGAFSKTELDMAREGLSFFRPLVEQWKRELQRRAA
jgi:O-antigen/teichoic acid export membrane protein